MLIKITGCVTCKFMLFPVCRKGFFLPNFKDAIAETFQAWSTPFVEDLYHVQLKLSLHCKDLDFCAQESSLYKLSLHSSLSISRYLLIINF